MQDENILPAGNCAAKLQNPDQESLRKVRRHRALANLLTEIAAYRGPRCKHVAEQPPYLHLQSNNYVHPRNQRQQEYGFRIDCA